MENINSLLLIVQVVLSVSLIVLILMQHGKGADAGAAFGSGASSTVFGSKGSGNFLSRATAIIATAFFCVCMGLAYLASHRTGPSSVIDSVINVETQYEQSNEGLDIPPADNSEGSASGTDLPPAD